MKISKKANIKETRNETREEVREVSVLFSDLLLPGWAEAGASGPGKVGLGSVTCMTGNGDEFTLPCHTADPELFFSEEPVQIAIAKKMCGSCPMASACLEGAISRAEPWGVWGGELFDAGSIIAAKRGVGRPRNRTLDESSTIEAGSEELVQAS